MRYHCRDTGRLVERSTGASNRREAEKIAAKWEAELQEGRYSKPSHMTWAAFREHYAANALPGLAARTDETYESTLNVFERICNPQKLSDVTTGRVTAFVTALRTQGKAEATIAHHLRHLKAILRWGNREGLLVVVPTITMPKRMKGAKIMRGRPISRSEFEDMLDAIPRVIENVAAESWRFYLRGLWASGLRLSESLSLRWDYAPGAIVVELEGRRPMLRIPAETQKSHRDTLLPITPDLAAILDSVPESERRGPVFVPLIVAGTPMLRERTAIGRTISKFGRAAGIVVDERQRRGKTVYKFASAHDLRRAFGQRWAAKVMPTVLRELMRHASINTTMAYYVGTNAEATADAVWKVSGDTLGDTSEFEGRWRNRENAKQLEK
jgi:integrase